MAEETAQDVNPLRDFFRFVYGAVEPTVASFKGVGTTFGKVMGGIGQGQKVDNKTLEEMEKMSYVDMWRAVQKVATTGMINSSAKLVLGEDAKPF